MFWLASGYSLDFGLIGGVVKTGTFNQFIRGGIAFATPPGTPLAPKARMASTSCCRRASRKSGGVGAPLCRSNALLPPRATPGAGEEQNAVCHAPGRLAKLRTLFSVVRCPWLKILSISLKRFSLKCARRCQRISLRRLYRRLSAPATPQYSRQYAED